MKNLLLVALMFLMTQNSFAKVEEKQKSEAEKSKQALEISKIFEKPIVTKILPASKFFVAEEYHQDYYKKSLGRYNSYRMLSGREKFLNRI